MKRSKASAPSVPVRLDSKSKRPVYQQLIDGVEAAIREGKLQSGDPLPSIRKLAEELDINHMTVAKAYRSLADRGVVQGNKGGGTRILGLQKANNPRTALQAESDARTEDIAIRMAELSAAPGVIALTDAFPVLSRQESDEFGQCVKEVLSRIGEGVFVYAAPAGASSLRQLLAETLATEGIPCGPDQIIVTAGAQQALDICARATLSAGDTVVVESPCYFGALDVFRAIGIRIVELPIRHDGIDPAEFQKICANETVKAFYTIPTVHNPTGVTTSEEVRKKLFDVVERHGIDIIEDDYCPELSFGSTVPPSYRTLSEGSDTNVFYVRSLGKIYLTGVRLGFIASPPNMVSALLRTKRATDLHNPLLLQEAAVGFLKKRMAHARKQKLAKSVMQQANDFHAGLVKHLPTGCSTRMVHGGFSFWISLPAMVPNQELYLAAIRQSVAFAPGSLFKASASSTSDGIRVSFGRLVGGEITEGAKRVSEALAAAMSRETQPAFIG
jgi:DNA-binding transcriptional MocR family regulator